MLSFVIVGSGYRAEYFGRVAATYPELFRCLFLCRSEEKIARMKKNTGMNATMKEEDCIAFEPDFIVIAVDYEHIADEALRWAGKGYPVLTETPVGSSWEKLALLEECAAKGGKIATCEQYHRHPLLAAGFQAVRDGLIGTPSSAYLSMVHDYHAASLIRRMLLTEGDPYQIHAVSRHNQVMESDSRYGAILDGSMKEVQRDTALITYASGKTAIYDFSSIQYRTYIRFRHLSVRGTLGEWSDGTILYMDEAHRPQRKMLTRDLPEAYRCLDTQSLRDIRRSCQTELCPGTLDDEYAIASILLDMGAYIAGGPSPYPLEEALEDARFTLRLKEALKQGQ